MTPQLRGCRHHPFGRAALKARVPFRLLHRICLRWEGGHLYSASLRRWFEDNFDIGIGAYSYGSCFVPGTLPQGSSVGRYCSFASGVRIFPRNHAIDWVSTHPFFFNSDLGFVDTDSVESIPITIGPDVWLGANALVTVACRSIGMGAIVGAGAVVTRDVPPFAIVAGNPAKLIRYRFDEDQRAALQASKWWEANIDELADARSSFLSSAPISDNDLALLRKLGS